MVVFVYFDLHFFFQHFCNFIVTTNLSMGWQL